MANQVETLAANAPIKSPPDKFYNFFKFNMSDLVKIFPAAFTQAQLIEGEEGEVGSVKLWKYILAIGGVPMTAKIKTVAIDDGGKSIKFEVVEGDVLLLYKSFKATLAVSEGSANWSLEFEKATILTPPPDLYLPVAVAASTLVDAYLLLA